MPQTKFLAELLKTKERGCGLGVVKLDTYKPFKVGGVKGSPYYLSLNATTGR